MLLRSASSEPVTALDRVTFNLAKGQICAVIGPNGAGKSTLFRILTGLTTPTSGQASVLGMDPVTEAHRIRRRIGFMPAEERTLFLRHTCRQNLRFHGRLQGMDERSLKARIDGVLDLVGLGEAKDLAGFALSSGMRARLMFARAILHEPEVLILDEPTGSVDPISAHEFLELIIKITVEHSTATLISSHRLEEIDALRNNVLLLDKGRAVFWGDLGRVKAVAEKKTYEIVCLDAEGARRVQSSLAARFGSDGQVTLEGTTVLVPATTASQIDILQMAGEDNIDSVSLRRLSLRQTITTLLAEGPTQ